MLSKNHHVEDKLRNIVLLEQKEEVERDYDWVKEQDDVNFWKFLSINYLELDRFFTLLDVETGPNSGWEKFVEALGLILWEDRKWCHQCGYHNGAGPTRVALAKIIERKGYDENLSLGSVLEILQEMDRYDILLQIDWQHLTDKYRKRESSDVSIKMKEQTSVFHLNLAANASHLGKSECIDYTNISSTLENSAVEKFAFKSKKRNRINHSDIYILMSYASDTEDYALKIANELRANSSEKKLLKIVMLGDPTIKRVLATDRTNILHKWFNQVRYVVPILSPQYLRQVQNLDNDEGDHELALRNKFIYKLTLDQYYNFGSRNLRCRPICPDLFYTQVKNHSVVKNNGLFSIIWNCSNENQVNDFALVLLDKPLLKE